MAVFDDGVLNVVKSSKETEWEWKIENFSLSRGLYSSPYVMFEGASWYLDLFLNRTDGYIQLCLLYSLSYGSPIEVEFSVALKTTEGRKRFERHKKKCFRRSDRSYEIKKWIRRSEFSNQHREFLSSGCLTILLTMKKADSAKTETVSAASASSSSKDSLRRNKISLDRKFLDKLVKCPQCDEVISLKNWLFHVCQMANVEAVSAASACSCCKGSLQGNKISFHQKCLEKNRIKCPRCDEMVSLQKWFDHKCLQANMIAASAASTCSWCKGNVQRDKISFHQTCLKRKRAKCLICDELVSLQKWFDHKCKEPSTKAGSSSVASFDCKGSLHSDRNSFHKDCLNKAAKRPRCDDIVSLQNWRHRDYQMANAKAATSITESSMICGHHKILQDLKQLLLNQEQTDVVLRVKGKEFPAHKAILAARSPVFASTFRNRIKEKKTGIVEIEDCDPSVFPDFLRFLYSNDADTLSGESVFGIFTIADKYDCQDLAAKCVRFIKDNLTVEIFCKALALALLHSEAKLLRVVTDFFIKNAEKILVTVEWQTFVAENPTYSNELFIKYVNSTERSNICVNNQSK